MKNKPHHDDQRVKLNNICENQPNRRTSGNILLLRLWFFLTFTLKHHFVIFFYIEIWYYCLYLVPFQFQYSIWYHLVILYHFRRARNGYQDTWLEDSGYRDIVGFTRDSLRLERCRSYVPFMASRGFEGVSIGSSCKAFFF